MKPLLQLAERWTNDAGTSLDWRCSLELAFAVEAASAADNAGLVPDRGLDLSQAGTAGG